MTAWKAAEILVEEGIGNSWQTHLAGPSVALKPFKGVGRMQWGQEKIYGDGGVVGDEMNKQHLSKHRN